MTKVFNTRQTNTQGQRFDNYCGPNREKHNSIHLADECGTYSYLIVFSFSNGLAASKGFAMTVTAKVPLDLWHERRFLLNGERPRL